MAAVPQQQAPREYSVVIIGAGIAGLCMGIQLRKLGIDDFVIFEKAAGIGGTWRDNTYPGAACDVPAIFYSFSFELNPNWSSRFPQQPEILAYLEHCTDKYGIRPFIRFNSEITQARFDAQNGRWEVTSAAGEQAFGRILVNGVGQLNRPYLPKIAGQDDFKGVSFHSARWNHDHDLRNRKVAVIGTGPSAVQFIPEIAPKVAKLSVFQRTPNWLVPRPDPIYSEQQKERSRRHPLLLRAKRLGIWAAADVAWPMFKMGSQHPVRRVAERVVLWNMHRHLHDPELKRKLTPHYPMGCKRVQIEDDYYPALERPNVELITTPIERVTAQGVLTEDGVEHEADTLIYATGFRAVEFLAPMQVHGLDGRSLNEAWRQGAEAYLGMGLPGFPNFFMLYGPNTNLGHNSIIFMIEQQVQYVLRCLRALRQQDLKYLDLREDVMQRWQAECQQSLARTVWASGCHSWYKTADGKITNNWPYSTLTYWWRMRQAGIADYRLVQKNLGSQSVEPLQLGVV